MPLHFVVAEISGPRVELSGSEAHHAARVRRLQPGETVTLTDGSGRWATGTVTSAGATVTIDVATTEDRPRPAPAITLIQALAKGSRDEMAIEAATELGADRIVPWQAARSVSRWNAEKAITGQRRWQTIVREASKQSHRAWIPEVDQMVSGQGLAAWISAYDGEVLVLSPGASEPLSAVEPRGNTALIVGPEGGIAPDELDQLGDAGALPVAVGSEVLRTSTAGPAAIAVLSVALGRW